MLTVYLHALLGSREGVDDLFQETMLVAWRRFADYDRSRPFGPWVRGIALRLVRKHRERVRGELPAELEEPMAAHADTPAALRDTLERLGRCMERLPADLREAIERTYRGGLTVREIARETGASEEAVKKRLQRGRRRLAECLKGGPR